MKSMVSMVFLLGSTGSLKRDNMKQQKHMCQSMAGYLFKQYECSRMCSKKFKEVHLCESELGHAMFLFFNSWRVQQQTEESFR